MSFFLFSIVLSRCAEFYVLPMSLHLSCSLKPFQDSTAQDSLRVLAIPIVNEYLIPPTQLTQFNVNVFSVPPVFFQDSTVSYIHVMPSITTIFTLLKKDF